ncbi:hypothetical protein M8818_002790 [Zalaria obscura]|uniref:Uncharacterized protein n=1 Tax=Zalaria obscura TaxID=2024903 RepID=A0ACC3SGW7_9PEZI
MYDAYYQQLIGEDAKFAPQSGNKVVEIFADGRKLARDISDPQIPAWAQKWNGEEKPKQTEESPRLRLLLCSPEDRHVDLGLTPMPISKHSLESLRRAWHLPTEFVRMLLSTMPMAVGFSVDDGLMLRGGRSRDWNYCLATVHDTASGITSVIVRGLCPLEYKKFEECLQASSKLATHPMLVPLILVKMKIHYFAVLLERRERGLELIEHETGMRHGFSENPERNRSQKDRARSRANMDYDPITQKLTGLAGTFALIEEVGRKIDPGATNDNLPAPFKRRIEYLRTLIAGAQSTRALLDRRTQAQVQTVYSLISQRDAEASLNDNQIMRTIAEGSHTVAVAARRDSVDMRVITAITLVFLPGTFTAVSATQVIPFLSSDFGD